MWPRHTASKTPSLCNLACHGVQHSTILLASGQYCTPWPAATGFGHCIIGSGACLSRECSPLLCLRLNFSFGFGGQLKNRGLLTFFEVRQQHDPAVREFKRIVMGYNFVLVDLPKDRGVVFDCRPAPSKQASWKARNLTGKGQLRSGSDANRNVCIFRCRKASRAGSKVVCGELVANPCGSRFHTLKAVITHIGTLHRESPLANFKLTHFPPAQQPKALGTGTPDLAVRSWLSELGCRHEERPTLAALEKMVLCVRSNLFANELSHNHK